MRKLRRNYRSISNRFMRLGRGDQDTMSRSSQWSLNAWDVVRIANSKSIGNRRAESDKDLKGNDQDCNS